MSFRTDLAVELKPDIHKKTGGVSAFQEQYGEITVTTIEVENEIGERLLGKPKGTYISFALPPLLEESDSAPAQSIITARLKKLLPKQRGCALVVGLGNRAITPDALGPNTAEKILATRHIKEELGTVEGLEALQPVAVLSPGVLGKTGIETLELIRGAVKAVKPSVVIVIDAFAARESERLGNTVQIASSGICPGSGVGNSRKAVNQSSLGVPVISIGVPTVVDAATLLADAAGEQAAESAKPFGREMFVTPREIDLIIHRAARLLARVLNTALQPAYSWEQIQSLMA
ncbi:MAG: GPR endopeptidase [Clostridia bacterium]|nr:GPR endopeptidase [Clostridia bacterium]